jgi:hypothetical protein
MSNPHVLVLVDPSGRWTDVLGPFPTAGRAESFRRRLAEETNRRDYFGLGPGSLRVMPLLAPAVYDAVRTETRREEVSA